jgi:hypothetical protein
MLKHLRQTAQLQKHKDNKWYVDVITSCPLDLNARNWRCGTKNGNKIIAASVEGTTSGFYRRISKPSKRVYLKVCCPIHLPEVSVVAIKANKYDTLHYAQGTEKTIDFARRCFNCVDKKIVKHRFMGMPFHQAILRRKYIFRTTNYSSSLKVEHRNHVAQRSSDVRN